MKVLLFVKESQTAIETSRKIESFLKAKGIDTEIFINAKNIRKKPELKNVGLLLVVGGDGTFLAGARLVAPLGIPLFGINEGRFGFLTEVEKNSAFGVLDSILRGEVIPQERMMISAYIKRKNSTHFLGSYLNDVVVSKSTIARMLEVDVYAKEEFITRVFGDGVIVSTPTGSTAYALSAGGPIVYPLSENLLFVPICPHTLSNRPLVLPGDFEIRIVNLSEDKMAFLTLDGQKGIHLKKLDEVIVKKSPYKCIMYPNPKRSFFEILREKLRWGA